MSTGNYKYQTGGSVRGGRISSVGEGQARSEHAGLSVEAMCPIGLSGSLNGTFLETRFGHRQREKD